MNYYRPTYARSEDLFESPPEERPFVDLSMSQDPSTLTPRGRRENTGVLRFANLIIGLAVDGARRRGVTAEQIRGAFDIGNVVAHATISAPEGEALEPVDEPSPYVGTVTITGNELQVESGTAGDPPTLDARVRFVRSGGIWVPQRAESWTLGQAEPHVVDLPTPFAIASTSEPREVPIELEAAAFMGGNEEAITASHSYVVMRGDLPNLQP